MAQDRDLDGRSADARRASRWAVAAGTVVIAVALIWLIIDTLLVGYLPLRWGGPNIGRGMILMLCYGLITGGVVIVALAGGFRVRRWRAWSWMVAGLIVALAVGFASVRIIEPRDLEAGQVGRLGLTVSDVGDPVLVFAICRGSVDRVQISGPNRGDVPNEVLALYRSNAPVRDGAQLGLGDPADGWTTDRVLRRDDIGAQKLVIATGGGEKTSLGQVSFSVDDLSALAPGEVLTGSGPYATRGSVADFRASACPSV